VDKLKSCLRDVERVLCINAYQQPLAVYRGLKPILDPFIIGQHLCLLLLFITVERHVTRFLQHCFTEPASTVISASTATTTRVLLLQFLSRSDDSIKHSHFLARDIIYTYCAYAAMSVSICL